MIEARELINAELDGVCGGFLDTTNVTSLVTKVLTSTNTASQIGAAVGGSSFIGNAGDASLVQAINQQSSSAIV